MTIAGDIIGLAQRASGILGVGQTALAQDTSDALLLLNEMIGYWNSQRLVAVIPGTLATFPDTTTDVASWTGKENVLVTNLCVRLRLAYALPADELQTKLATDALEILQANNLNVQPAVNGGIPSTALQVIYLALRMAGRVTDSVGMNPASADVAHALSLLNSMVAQWQRRRWLVPNLSDTAITSTGAASYTIGSGGTVAVARPDRLEYAYARSTLASSVANRADFPLTLIEAREDWSAITLKGQGTGANGYPGAVFYDSAWPLGRLYFWPVAGLNIELHIVHKAALTILATVNDALALPPEYTEALVANLACRIVMLTGKDAPPGLMAYARGTLNTITGANVQVPTMDMPFGLGGRMDAIGSGGAWAGGPYIPDPSTLPTTLPATPGIFWNNGGLVSIS